MSLGPIPEAAPALGHLGAARLEPRELVQRRQVGVRVQESLLLVLPVDVHQPAGQLAQLRGGHEHAVHEGPAASLGADLAAHDHFPPGGFEDRFDGGVGLCRADQFGRRPPPE